MQFINLQKQYKELKQEIDAAIHHVLDHSNYIMGEEVKELEKKLAEYVGVKHCITCGSGTDALTLAMKAYDVKEGDAVFVPDFTFYASAETVASTGAVPIFVDIDKDTFNLSAEDLERAIQEVLQGKMGKGAIKPRAVLAVDLFGLPANYSKLKEIAEACNLLIIEDAAQGFGGSIDGQRACSFGDIAATSFFPAKPLGCYGDGGAVFTDEDKVKDYLESIKVHGKGEDKYDNVRVGLNSRLDTIQAAVLLPKLKAFQNYELESRTKIARQYDRLLGELGDAIRTPVIPDGYRSSYAQYSILFKEERERDKMKECLQQKGIPTMIYYRKCMHQQTVHRNNPAIYRGFQNAGSISKRILNLPMDPYLSEQEIDLICKTIKESIQK